MTTPLNILLLGSGGRENALAWKIAQSPHTAHLYIAPGNGGTHRHGTNVDISPLDFNAIDQFAATHSIHLIVVGNEDPLCAGIWDHFQSPDCKSHPLICGPSRQGAALEGSKNFAKQFMARHNIPTAQYQSFTPQTLDQGYQFLQTLQPPYVLKADGLAAGKGVIILNHLDQAKQELRTMLSGKFGQSSSTVVIEQYLTGIECSVFILTDGNGSYRILPVAKDYKRIGNGDTGPNTGGMGAVSPVPFADTEFMQKVENRIIRPTLKGLQQENITYRGFIFLGLINVNSDPMVIEYNVRMGDPETEVVMPRIATDIVPLLHAAAAGNLRDLPLHHDPRTATTVMAVSQGYPEAYTKGHPITGLDTAQQTGAILFHAGTTTDPQGQTLTAGGRVIACTALGPDIPTALRTSYAAIQALNYQGKNYRTDIGQDLITPTH